MILVGKELRLLDLIRNIKEYTLYIEWNKVLIYSNNKCILNEYRKESYKESDIIKEAGAVIETIKREIDDTNINILLE